MSSIVDEVWVDALRLLETVGRRGTEDELRRRLRAHRGAGGDRDRAEALALVLATLQQKFGELQPALKALSELEKSRNSVISVDATVRLVKLLTQQGDFKTAKDRLSAIVPSRRIRRRFTTPRGISPSVYWRLAFLNGMVGDSRESEWRFEQHMDSNTGHSSQRGNNLTFSNIVAITKPDYDFVRALDRNREAAEEFLVDGLSVLDVKYVNVSKSVVVPLLLDGVILLQLRNTSDGLLQLMLCRRLMQLEGLTIQAEGIGDAVTALQRMSHPEVREFLQRIGTSDTAFLAWVAHVVPNPRLVRHLVDELEVRFAEFTRTRDYRLLSVLESGRLLGRLTGRQERIPMTTSEPHRIFIIHGHDELNRLRLKALLDRQPGIQPVTLTDEVRAGSTLIEKFESVAETCEGAVALFTSDDAVMKDGETHLQPRPNVLFEIGWFYGRKGRQRVLIVFQDSVKLPSDLDGIERVEFTKNVEDKGLVIANALQLLLTSH